MLLRLMMMMTVMMSGVSCVMVKQGSSFSLSCPDQDTTHDDDETSSWKYCEWKHKVTWNNSRIMPTANHSNKNQNQQNNTIMCFIKPGIQFISEIEIL